MTDDESTQFIYVTDNELDFLEMHINNATSDPWILIDRSEDGKYDKKTHRYDVSGPPSAVFGQYKYYSDAAFVVVAKHAMPRLIAEIRKLRVQNSELLHLFCNKKSDEVNE